MANNLWTAALRLATAALRPTVPDFPLETFGFHYDSDTGTVQVGIAGGSVWVPLGAYRAQPTPTAKTGDATLTAAELLTRIITATKASAVALTLPLGTDTDAGVAGGTLKVDQSFEWEVINLGSSSGAVTMTASTGHTYVGAAVVAISTSAKFRTRKTAAGVFVTYRVS